jgi:hypothetical protein
MVSAASPRADDPKMVETWFDRNWIIIVTFGNYFRYKPTTRRFVPIFYGDLRPAGAQTVCLLRFMLQMYNTQQKTFLLKITIHQRTPLW